MTTERRPPRNEAPSGYGRFMIWLGWLLVVMSLVALVIGVLAAFSLTGEYGWGDAEDVFAGAMTIVVLALVPGLAGWLVLRIGRRATR